MNLEYMHNVYNHSNGAFGLTSLIENIWAELKNSIKKYILQFTIPIIYFLKKAEYRRIVKLLILENKLKDFATLLTTLKIGDEINYINEDDLKSFNYEAFYDD